MGSPTKQKYKQSLQHQMLTNYYLSKYDKYVPRGNQRKSQIMTQRQPSQYMSNNPRRKNFKQLILQKKANLIRQRNRQLSGRKNFKQQISRKNSKQKIQKQNKKVFHHLQDTIVNQLYRPSPSLLQKGKYDQIQILHRISYQDRPQKIQPFRLKSYEREQNQNIQIIDNKGMNENQDYQVSFQRLQHQRISQSIKATFQKRSPSQNKSKNASPKSKSPKSISPKNVSPRNGQIKKLPKSPQNKFPPKYQSNNNSHQDSDIFQNVRPNFFQQRQNSGKQTHNQISQNSGNNLKINILKQNSFHSQKKSQDFQKSQQKSVQKPYFKNKKTSRKNSFAQSVKKNSSFNDDSFHRSIPDIQLEPKLMLQKQKQEQRFQQHHSNSHHSEKKSSEAHNQSLHKQSLHDFSMISRFSMTSDEGGVIKQQLEKQLNQNQFGPYQNALTSLLHLIDIYPNAWPIFVVGQRILQDRNQYQNKRKMQQNQISKLQASIQSINRIKSKRTQIQNNNITILNLIRKLSQTIQKDK